MTPAIAERLFDVPRGSKGCGRINGSGYGRVRFGDLILSLRDLLLWPSPHHLKFMALSADRRLQPRGRG
jgi:hypothetical protein